MLTYNRSQHNRRTKYGELAIELDFCTYGNGFLRFHPFQAFIALLMRGTEPHVFYLRYSMHSPSIKPTSRSENER